MAIVMFDVGQGHATSFEYQESIEEFVLHENEDLVIEGSDLA